MITAPSPALVGLALAVSVSSIIATPETATARPKRALPRSYRGRSGCRGGNRRVSGTAQLSRIGFNG